MSMRASAFITVLIPLLALAILAWPLSAAAQQTGRIPRIGVLVPAEPASPTEPNIGAFRQALHDLGYVEGQNVAVEYRYAHGKAELYPKLATELVRLNVDIIVVGSGAPTREVQNATQRIPIVGVGLGADPVGVGFVESLARPGGNLTGLSFLAGRGFVGKLVELLKEAAPGISRVGYLRDARGNVQQHALNLKDLRSATEALGLKLQDLPVRELGELDGVFAAMGKERGGAFITGTEPRFYLHRSQITELASRYRLPAVYGSRIFVDAGGLMSYGPSLPDLWRRAATYVDKILKGAKPSDLPVEQPTKFELIINRKTANALGLTIQSPLLLRADRVIE
jgi:putative ABC transport system substrate-binding protein